MEEKETKHRSTIIRNMGLYEGIKDVAKVLQQADNIDLYRQLLDLSAQALDMQNMIYQLTIENAELKKKQDLEERIQRHQLLYLTLKDDADDFFYCSTCWDKDKKLIQMSKSHGVFFCPHCHQDGIYDQPEYDNYVRSRGF